jgi:ATP-dependent Clp protease ATP-binding subunit ClpA
MVDVEQIARLLFARLIAEMDEKGIELSISDEGLSYLATAGFDPEFGARPLRRVIQEKVENKLAELVLSGHIKRRDKISIGTNGEFKIIEKL